MTEIRIVNRAQTEWAHTKAVLAHPKVVVPSIGAAVVIAVANIVADQPEYKDTPILGGINRAWDSAVDPIFDGVSKFAELFDVSEAPELVPTSRLARQLPPPERQVRDASFEAAVQLPGPSLGLV